jgi:large subunit ribosomal protein L5
MAKKDKKQAEETGAGEGASAKEPPRLLVKYKTEVLPALMKRFGYKNVMQAPKLVKVTLNMGVGEGARDVKVVETAEAELALIAGQKAKRARSRVSVSAFKLREGMPVGCMVTLRGHRMYEFLDRLINVSIPRIRDFRGLPTAGFDGRGNHSFGIREHIIFLELDFNKVAQTKGMNINTTTTAKTDEEARELLTLLGMPFRQS